MAAITHAATATWSTTGGNTTVTATPALFDLIVIVAPATGVATSSITDNNADGQGTYVKIGSSFTGFSTAGDLSVWVRKSLIFSATSTVFTATQTASTGGGLDVYRVSGMTRAGTLAVRSSGGQSTGTAATTPAPVLSLTPLTGNPIITAVCNGTSPGGVTQPTSYTESTNLGYATPTTGLDTAWINSGITNATITWGSTSATAFASIAIELDTSALPAGPVFKMRQSPIQAQKPLSQQRISGIPGPRGRVYGINTSGGPVQNPTSGPVLGWSGSAGNRVIQLRAGSCLGSRGAPVNNPVSGPQLGWGNPSGVRVSLVRTGVAMATPVLAAALPPPPQTGPVFKQAQQPAQAKFPLPRRGVCRAIRFGPLPNNPTQGPPFKQAQSPARARRLPQQRGRVYVTPITRVTTAPPPVGPVFEQAQQPAQARLPLPRRGRIYGISSGAPVQNPSRGPAFTQRPYPIQATDPLPRRGRIGSNPGIPVQAPAVIGPPFSPRNQALRAQPGNRPGLIYASVTGSSGTPGSAGITRVNSAALTGGSTGANVTVTIPGGTGISAGDLIVCSAVGNGTTPNTSMSVKDSVNGTNFTRLLATDETNSSAFWLVTFWFVTPGAIADGSTITLTTAASATAAGFAVDVFRGCAGTIDQAVVGPTNSTAGTSEPAPALGGNATAGSLVLTFVAGGSADSQTPGSPFTGGSINAANRSCGNAYVLSASGSSTYASTWTQGTSGSWATQTVSFSAAPVGAAGSEIGSYFTGRIGANYGAKIQNPTRGPVFFPRPRPVQAANPLPRRGWVGSNPGGPVQNPVPSTTGPVFKQAQSPAKAKLPSQGQQLQPPGLIQESLRPSRNPTAYASGTVGAAVSFGTFSVTAPTRSGDALVVTVAMGGSGSPAVTSVTDTQGNNYALLQSFAPPSTAPLLYVYAATGATNPLAASDSVTANFAGNTVNGAGLVGTSCPGIVSVDAVSAAASGTSVTASVTGTPSFGGENALAAFTWSNPGGTGTIASPFAQVAQNHVASNIFTTVAYASNPTARAALTASATITSTAWRAILITLTPAGTYAPSYATGRISASYGAPAQNPTTGPVFRQVTSPIQARRQPLRPGRTYTAPIAPVTATPPPVGPVFIQKPYPVQAVEPLPRRGRIYGVSSGAPVQNPSQGPVFRSRPYPVQAADPLPRRGRVYGVNTSGAPVQNPASGPVFIQKPYPVQATDPLPRRGRVYGVNGSGAPVRNPSAGPFFKQAAAPVQARFPLPLRGRTYSNPGGPVQNPAPVVIGPPFFPFRQAVHIRFTLPPKGRNSGNKGAPVQNPTSGPVFRQLTHPVQAKTPLFRTGRNDSLPGGPVVNPTIGPPFYPAVQALRARLPVPFLKGRVSGNAGAPVRNPVAGPVFRQLPHPVQSRQPLPPKGRVYSNPGGPVQNPPPIVIGPVFHQATSPARIRPSLPPRGRISANPGAPVRNPVQGPAFRQAVHPIQARIPQTWSKGRIYSNPGGPLVTQGPRFVQLPHPVQARQPLPPKGRVYSGPGGPLFTQGPVFRQLTHPVQARQPLPPRGRVSSNPGIPVIPPAIGPRFIQRHDPARIRPSLPPRGRVASNKGAPVRNPTAGPRFVQAVRPIRAVIPQNAPRGRTGSNPGGPVQNIPVRRMVLALGLPFTDWGTGDPLGKWEPGLAFVKWGAGQPLIAWETGLVYTDFSDSSVVGYQATYGSTY